MGVHPDYTHCVIASCHSLGVCPTTVDASENPGLTVFTVIPCRPSATAKYRLTLSIAAFADPMPTQGCQPPVCPPRVYESPMIRPPPPMYFAAVRAQMKNARAWV